MTKSVVNSTLYSHFIQHEQSNGDILFFFFFFLSPVFLLLLAHFAAFILFGVGGEDAPLKMVLGWVQPPQQAPSAALERQTSAVSSVSSAEELPHAMVSRQVLRKGNLVPPARAVLGHVICARGTGCIYT